MKHLIRYKEKTIGPCCNTCKAFKKNICHKYEFRTKGNSVCEVGFSSLNSGRSYPQQLEIYQKIKAKKAKRKREKVDLVKTDKSDREIAQGVFWYLKSIGYLRHETLQTWRKERHIVLKYMFTSYRSSRDTIISMGYYLLKNSSLKGFPLKRNPEASADKYYGLSKKVKKVVTRSHYPEGFYSSREWRSLRVKALVKNGRRCCLCGATPREGVVLHVDHIKPRSLYPELELELDNLQILCEACNLGKSNHYTDDWRL